MNFSSAGGLEFKASVAAEKRTVEATEAESADNSTGGPSFISASEKKPSKMKEVDDQKQASSKNMVRMIQ